MIGQTRLMTKNIEEMDFVSCKNCGDQQDGKVIEVHYDKVLLYKCSVLCQEN